MCTDRERLDIIISSGRARINCSREGKVQVTCDNWANSHLNRPVSVIALEKGMACSLDNVKTAVGFGNVSSQDLTISDAVQWSERTEMVLGDFGTEYPIITNRTELRVSIDTNSYVSLTNKYIILFCINV
ncbi:hypothetical protein CDAR_587571 [Caerostris darwini]|uniref:Uncharacterized protein n=1 Tax=Caerostris darwini TaxID=1538125 RepID=A0AAV4SHA7_9ARAC|nr:hypothetical protein CDAR_587571 [Caerostris darwini]